MPGAKVVALPCEATPEPTPGYSTRRTMPTAFSANQLAEPDVHSDEPPYLVCVPTPTLPRSDVVMRGQSFRPNFACSWVQAQQAPRVGPQAAIRIPDSWRGRHRPGLPVKRAHRPRGLQGVPCKRMQANVSVRHIWLRKKELLQYLREYFDIIRVKLMYFRIYHYKISTLLGYLYIVSISFMHMNQVLCMHTSYYLL